MGCCIGGDQKTLRQLEIRLEFALAEVKLLQMRLSSLKMFNASRCDYPQTY